MGRTIKAEGVVLRSIRLGEADRVLHVYTREHGRVGLVAKGVRRTRSRFGARLEPLTHVSLLLHRGSGELGTVTGADILDSHRAVREQPERLAAGLAGAETVGRLFAEGEASPRAFEALCRYLEALEARAAPARPIAHDPALLALGLKLHWVAGFAPVLDRCASCGGGEAPLERFSASAGGATCAACPGGFPIRPGTLHALAALLRAPLAEAPELPGGTAAEAARAVAELHAEHGGFRLRSLALLEPVSR
jgi:DNA repair protein RecO (recombination protein O)